MIRTSPPRATGLALIALLTLVLAACSSTGGKRPRSSPPMLGGPANTPHWTFAMVTHSAPVTPSGTSCRAAPSRPPPRTTSTSSTPTATTPTSRLSSSRPPSTARRRPGRHPRQPGTPQAVVAKAVKAGIPVITFNSGVARRSSARWPLRPGRDDRRQGGRRRLTEGGKKRAVRAARAGPRRARGALRGREADLAPARWTICMSTAPTCPTCSPPSGQAQAGQVHRLRRHPRRAVRPDAVKASQASSNAKIGTFDLNAAGRHDQVRPGAVGRRPAAVPAGLRGHRLAVAVPINGDILGGGQPVLTGPSSSTGQRRHGGGYAERGTR